MNKPIRITCITGAGQPAKGMTSNEATTPPVLPRISRWLSASTINQSAIKPMTNDQRM